MKLTVVASALKAAVERLGPIHLAYEIGEFLLHIRKLDPVAISDGTGVLGQLFLSFFKSKTDNASVAEDLAYEFHKTLRDEAGFADHQVFAFIKAVHDAASVSEARAMSLTKPAADQFTVLEGSVLALTKGLVEHLGFSDDEVISFIKILVDGSVVSDSFAQSFSKPANDAAETLDEYASALTKVLVDHLNVTDDIDGVASILDDENMQFIKGTTDIAAVTDVIYILIEAVREFADTAAAFDAAAVQFGKALTDATAAAQDSVALAPNKGLSDESFFTDLVNRNSSKGLSDNSQVIDSTAFGLETVKKESALVSDTGMVRIQGYAEDFSYFAGDYVGISQTF
jgi:hypothetical protein